MKRVARKSVRSACRAALVAGASLALVWAATSHVRKAAAAPAGEPAKSAGPPATADAGTGPLAKVRPFVESHCYDCHTGKDAEGGLDFEALSTDLSSAGTLSKWVRIHDRVQRGEMPPGQKAKKVEPHKPAFLTSLGGALTQASAAQAQTVIRRLNRVEYENTLRDLLGVRTEVQGMLPEDGKAHGFDTVGEALDLSPVQLQRYMEAAGKALDESFVGAPRPEPKTVPAPVDAGRNMEFVGKHWLKRKDDGHLVVFNDGNYPSIRPGEFKAEFEGTYRFHLSAYAYQTDKTVPFEAHLGSDGFTGTVQTTYHQVAPGEPQAFVIEGYLRKGGTIRLWPKKLPNAYNKLTKDGPEKYEGPGFAIAKLEAEGPLPDPAFGRGMKLRFGDLEVVDVGPAKERAKKHYKPWYKIESKDPAADAARLLPAFAAAAFRRPVTEGEVAPYLELAKAQLAGGANFDQALRTAHVAILCSPDFLYLVEPANGKLDGYALASRLSYLFWSTLPDAALLDAAAKGGLSTPAGLRAQTERLLADPRAARFTKNFTGQWLNLREIDFTTPDKQLYPEYDDALKDAMVRETESFFDEVLGKNRPLLDFIDSDWTFANERLAAQYRIDGVAGTEMRKVPLKPEHRRGGLLTHASVLKVSANGTTTSPVVRGAWVLERILGYRPPPPPPGTPGVEPDIRGATTLRQQLDQHRDNATCNACHKVIDPPGFALESYDVMGGFRDTYRSLNKKFPGPKREQMGGQPYVSWRIGPPVDATGVTPDGKPFKDLAEYKRILLDDKATVTRALVEKVATYGTGRGMGFSDRPKVEQIAAAVARKGYGFRDLVHEVVQSELFRNK